MKLPHVVLDARVYLEDRLLVGQGSVALPNLQPMSESVKGAGFAGEVELPLIGQYQSMQCKIDFSSITEDAVSLAAPETRTITVRGSQQIHDTATGIAGTVPVVAFMRVHPKSVDLGKLEKGSGSDTSIELEALSIRLLVDGIEKVWIDKANYVCRFDGVDYLEKVRADLGMT